MNDDFLYKLRADPPRQFATRLKARLDAAPSRRTLTLRWGIGLLLFGTAFALVSPDVRNSVEQLFAHPREAEVPTAAVSSGSENHPATADAPRVMPPVPATAPRVLPKSPFEPPPPRDESQPEPAAPPESRGRLAEPIASGPARIDMRISSRPVYAGVENADTPEGQARQAIELRRSLFVVLASTAGPLDSMGWAVARGLRPFDARATETSALRIVLLSSMIPELFAADTRKFDPDPRALAPDIWTHRNDFVMKADELTDIARHLAAAASAGDQAKALQLTASLSRACVTCHKQYLRADRADGAR